MCRIVRTYITNQQIHNIMKTLFYIEVTKPIYTSFYYVIFRLYLKLIKYGYSSANKTRVYDNLGLIDTLGSDVEVTKLTRHYSDELTSIYAIKLPFGYNIELTNGCGYKEICICKNRINLY